ncbi:MAG: hypothetical protein ACTSU9_16130 [Promethearchaeota archaeon]
MKRIGEPGISGGGKGTLQVMIKGKAGGLLVAGCWLGKGSLITVNSHG